MSLTQIVTRQLKDAAVTLAKLGIFTTKGDLVGYSGSANTVLSVGIDGQQIIADASATTGLRWVDSYTSYRNRIINGDMRFSQRNTTFTAAGSGSWSLDRFGVRFGTSGVVTITQDTDVPASLNVPFSLKLNVTTADNTVSAGDFFNLAQHIEGYHFLPLKGQQITLSFWVKSNVAGVFCVNFQNSAYDRSYTATYTIASANTWQKQVVTFTHSTSGTWLYDTGCGMRVGWCLMCGSTFQTTAGAWQAGNFLGTSGQQNVLAATSNNFFLTGVQLELGPVPTAFEFIPQTSELLLCNRYFVKSYDVATVPGTVTSAGENRYIAAGTGGEAATFTAFGINLRSGTPTMTFYSPPTGASGKRRNYSAAADENLTAFNTLGERGGSGSNTGHTTGSIYGFHYTADAEVPF